MNEAPPHIVVDLLAMTGFGFTVTVKIKSAPVQVGPTGVTV